MTARWRAAGWLAGAAAVAGCSSPADVQRRHDELTASYESEMARAHEWNVHVLGIPAAGWLSLVILGSVLVFALLVLAGLWAREAHAVRSRHRQSLALEREKTRQAAVSRGQCPVCGAHPPLSGEAQP